MEEVKKLLAKYQLTAQQEAGLELPHIMYERRGINQEIVISKNFILEYKMLAEKGYIRAEDLEGSFYKFEKQYFSKYFFQEDTDLKWNYYLIIIVNGNAEEDETVCQLENDDKFLRKLVMTTEELDIYLGHGGAGNENRKSDIPGIDIYGEWQRNLSSLKLDGILTSSFESSKVQEYIENGIGIRPQGRPISNWEKTGSGDSRYLVEKIDSLYIKEFREHCLQKNAELLLSRVNLFSGSNGSGKSSLCAAIEYAMTGEIFDGTAEGSVSVKIRNKEGEQNTLKSEIQLKEKRELDRLWYGTTTTAYKSLLNKHFHTFNYLGLEASREYITNLEINELVKNVLFGTEITEAEKKMQRYGKEFADRKKAYDKKGKENMLDLKEQLGKMKAVESLPKEEIMGLLQGLGYKKFSIEEKGLEDYVFLKKLSELCARYHGEANQLFYLCGENEDGRGIAEKKAEWQIKREKYQLYKENEKRLSIIRQKRKDSKKLIHEYSEKLSRADDLYCQANVVEGAFSNKWDFQEWDNAYRQSIRKNEELVQWMERYRDVLDVEEDAAQLEAGIEARKAEIEEIRQSIEGISKEIEAQKCLKDSLDVVMQEIYSISERYIKLHPNAVNCPMCGADHKGNIAFKAALRNHKKYEEADNVLFQKLLNSRMEKEQALSDGEQALQKMIRIKTKIQEKQQAVASVKDLVDLDGRESIRAIMTAVECEAEKLQSWIECHKKTWNYIKMVLESDEFAEYDGSVEWIVYLEETIRELKKKIEGEARQIKELELQEQNLVWDQKTEEGVFQEEEWKNFQLKASAYENLAVNWNIPTDVPLRQWAKDFANFRQRVEYAQELYGKQREYSDKKLLIEKLQKDIEQLEEKSRRCQEAYALIDGQKKLEDIMKEFLKENEKQIELFFRILHRPKEFGMLKISDGNLRIVRNSNGKVVESSQMSTGQRMALAFSVMITLHKNAPNAPGFLMLDEPVANLDDIHVLNLIDLLRELAINGTQIIITTADRQMAKYLRRKFSFFQNEYTHFELNRKGSEKTFIKINHYSYDKKEVMD